MKNRPSICCIENGKILLLQYTYNQATVYCLPGGNVDFGETLEQCIVRELTEEIGLKVQVGPCLLIVETPTRDQNDYILHHIYLATSFNGKIEINKNETTAQAAEWVNLETLAKLNLYPNIAEDLLEQLSETEPKLKYLGVIPQTWH
jgi:8-oxo-dGTP diphosphatase